MRLSKGLLINATLFAITALGQEPDGIVEKAKELAHSGRFQQAEQILRQAIESQPGTPSLQGELGSLLYSSKRFDEAIEHLGRAAQLDQPAVQAQQRAGVRVLGLDGGREGIRLGSYSNNSADYAPQAIRE